MMSKTAFFLSLGAGVMVALGLTDVLGLKAEPFRLLFVTGLCAIVALGLRLVLGPITLE